MGYEKRTDGQSKRRRQYQESVIPGLVPGIHVLLIIVAAKTGMAGTSASGSDAVLRTAVPGHDEL
jgi:hypothetical protein